MKALLVMSLAAGALLSAGCGTPDTACLQAELGCASDLDGDQESNCRFGARSARDFLKKDFAPYSHGVDASAELLAAASRRTHQHCEQHTSTQSGYDACVDGVSRFVAAMQ